MNHKWKIGMIELIALFVGGFAVGVAATVGITQQKKEAEKPIIIKQHEGTEEAIKQLTELDLTQPLCSPEYIKDNTDLLCRELTCLQFSRGLDSQTFGAQCEAISNIANKIRIESWCNQYQDPGLKADCIELFWKRN